MEASQLSLIIALLPSLNMQKMRQNEPLFTLFPTQHGKSGQRHGLGKYPLCPFQSEMEYKIFGLPDLQRQSKSDAHCHGQNA